MSAAPSDGVAASGADSVPSLVRRIRAASSLVGGWSGMAIMIFIVTIVPDLFSRAIFKTAIPMADDIGVTSLVAVAFLGLAVAQSKGEHFDMRVLDHVLPARPLAVLRVIRLALSLAIVAVTAVLCIDATIESVRHGEVTMSIIAFPVWPARFMVAAGLVLLALQLCSDLYLGCRAVRDAA